MMQDRQKKLWMPMWHSGMAVALMAGSLLFWWFHFWADAIVLVSQPESVSPLQVIDVTAAERLDWWERAQIWSPTRFALPEPGGFSDDIHHRRITVLPPVDQPAAMAMSLGDRVSGDHSHPTRLSALATPRAALFQPADPPSPILPEAETPFERTDHPIIQRVESIPAREVEQSKWPPESAIDWGEKSWMLKGVLYVDALGVVTHVLLDMEPTDPDISEQIRRILHQWRWQPGTTHSVVRMEILYDGRRLAGGAMQDG